jgi:methionyl aminopeptidase
VLDLLKHEINPGVSTGYLDRLAEKLIGERGAVPAFKGYRNYPCTICASVNEEVVHGIPNPKRKLKNGDIVSIDLGVYCDGYYGDAAITFPIGAISDAARRLMDVTREALYVGIEKAVGGNYLFEVSQAIQEYVEKNDFSVVRDFVGHGIGTELHEEPQIPNFKPEGNGMGPVMKKGMVLAIEPMVNMGSYDVKVLEDNWTAVTLDGKLSAHFEHTIAVTDGKADILSLTP